MKRGSKLRSEDNRKNKIMEEFLNKHLYNSSVVNNFERKNDKASQVNGIDVMFEYDNELFLCDEKVATSYINKPLRTFSLELSYLNRASELSEGWLINKNLKTNSYLFVWVDKCKTDYLGSVDDILEVEVILIKKEKILNFLNNKGWTNDKLLIKSNRIRNNEKEYLGSIPIHGYKFSYSPKLFEKPINIIIPRTFYRENCVFNKIVKQ